MNFKIFQVNFDFIAGGSRKNSRSNTPVIPEEEEASKNNAKEENNSGDSVNDESGKEQEQSSKNWCNKEENVSLDHQASLTQQQQPIVVEPNEQDHLQFNIEYFLGNIIGFPGIFIMVFV